MENEDECKSSCCLKNTDFLLEFYLCCLLILVDMIHENSPVTNSFVSVPADMGHLNCAAFIAGIIAGMLDSARFVRVSIAL